MMKHTALSTVSRTMQPCPASVKVQLSVMQVCHGVFFQEAVPVACFSFADCILGSPIFSSRYNRAPCDKHHACLACYHLLLFLLLLLLLPAVLCLFLVGCC